jgi:uncharacterized protein (DUF427 family)
MTTTQEPKLPGPDHPITVTPFAGRVRVRLGQSTVADTTDALELREANYPPVMYVPLADVDPATLMPSDTMTYCPYKGDAKYYSVREDTESDVIADALWYYATPYPAVSEIAGYAAFYPDKVQITAERSKDE